MGFTRGLKCLNKVFYKSVNHYTTNINDLLKIISFVKTLKGKISPGQESLNYKKKQNLIKEKIVQNLTTFYQWFCIKVKAMGKPQETSLKRYHLLVLYMYWVLSIYHPSLQAGFLGCFLCLYIADMSIVFADRPTLAGLCISVYMRTSLVSAPFLVQQCLACIVCLNWMVDEIGQSWSFNGYFVGYCFQDLSKILV